jgi:elongation factor G
MALISITVVPNTLADAQWLALGAHRLAMEDPTLSASIDDDTGVAEIGAMSPLQLEIAIDRLCREFHVEGSTGVPAVAYKEAFAAAAEGDGKYFSKEGPRRGYGHVKIRLFPGRPGSGFAIESQVAGGAVPDRYMPAIHDALDLCLQHGPLGGYPIEAARVVICDGSYHDADSTHAAFQEAAALAYKLAARDAKPVILEPIMRVVIDAPSRYAEDINRSLARRRGRFLSSEVRGNTDTIVAAVPLTQMFGFHNDLRVLTDGRGAHRMSLQGYERCPDEGWRGDRDALVGAPLRPLPPSGSSGIAVPEPQTDDTPGTNDARAEDHPLDSNWRQA